MTRTRALGVAIPLLWTMCLSAGCAGPGVTAPERLPLLVDVTIDGQPPAGTPLRVILDGVPTAELPPSGGLVTLQVRQGKRTVELAGFASGCTIEDGVQRRIDVRPSRASYVVSFELECADLARTG